MKILFVMAFATAAVVAGGAAIWGASTGHWEEGRNISENAIVVAGLLWFAGRLLGIKELQRKRRGWLEEQESPYLYIAGVFIFVLVCLGVFTLFNR
jgi:hypothetical protein